MKKVNQHSANRVKGFMRDGVLNISEMMETDAWNIEMARKSLSIVCTDDDRLVGG